MKKKIIIGVVVIVTIAAVLIGAKNLVILKMLNNEDPVFWERNIREIEARYESTPDVDIVFVGSSSIRKWETLEEDFVEYDVVNHGFGGSKVADTIYYFDRLVTVFNPESVVVYSGSNDIHGKNDNSKTGEEVFEQVKALVDKSQEELKGVPLYYISISPNKARWDVWKEVERANNLIKEYAESKEHFTYIDITDDMLKDGVPNQDLFASDSLHLNSEGYAIWTGVIKPIVTQNID